MARNKIRLNGDLFGDYMAKLDKLGGTEAMKRGTDKALIASKEYVNPLIESAMNKLPAGGKYSTGRTKRSIDTSDSVEWNGLTASIKVGFNLKESGLTSIFLMYGTPRMKPVSGLKSAVYGTKTQKEIAKLQEVELMKVIKEVMEGKDG